MATLAESLAMTWATQVLRTVAAVECTESERRCYLDAVEERVRELVGGTVCQGLDAERIALQACRESVRHLSLERAIPALEWLERTERCVDERQRGGFLGAPG